MEPDQPGEYQKLVIKQFPPRTLRETAEGAYWKRFKAPVLAQQVARVLHNLQHLLACPWQLDHQTLTGFGQQIGAVSHLSFSPVSPHQCAVTSSTRVGFCC